MTAPIPPNPGDDLEQRLTAYLLGELNEADAEAMRQALQKSPALTQWHDRLARTMGLVREAVSDQALQPGPEPAPLALAPEKRAQLLAAFKQRKAPAPERTVKRISFRDLMAIAAILLVISFLAAASLPALSRARSKASGAMASKHAETTDGIEGASVVNQWASPAAVDQTSPTVAFKSDEKQRSLIVLDNNNEGRAAEANGTTFLPKSRLSDNVRFHNKAGAEPVSPPPPAESRDDLPTLQKEKKPPGETESFGRSRPTPSDPRFHRNPFTEKPQTPARASRPEVKTAEPATSRKPSGQFQFFEEGKATVPSQMPVDAPAIQYASPAERSAPTSTVTNNLQFATPSLPAGPQAAGGMGGIGNRGSGIESRTRYSTIETPALGLAVDGVGLGQRDRAFASDLMPQEPGAIPSPATAKNFRTQGQTNDPDYAGTDALSFGISPASPSKKEPAVGLKVAGDGYNLNVVQAPLEIQEQEKLRLFKKDSLSPQKPSIQTASGVSQAKGEERLKLGETLEVMDDREAPVVSAKLTPLPEVVTKDNAFSTFSLNTTDVSFRLVQASLERNQLPTPGTVRTEEFINAFDYRDPEPARGAPVAFAWERSRHPFEHNRDLVRFSIKTGARGRGASRPMNLVLLIDNSGSMERADRQRITHECLKTLAQKLKAGDRVSVVGFSRTPRLWIDGMAGENAASMVDQVSAIAPEGGTNLELALDTAYERALHHFSQNGVNRVVLLTDGAANLGDVDPERLRRKVEANRKRGVALDCFGIGWEGFNDDLMATLSKSGDGRYGFINRPEDAATDFARSLAGALEVAASDVKVQVEFNPRRVTLYRQLGYTTHQLTKEQFRDNTVDAAELGAAEAGNALYTLQVDPRGEGPLGTVRVRYKVPGTGIYREQSWNLDYQPTSIPLEQTSAAMKLCSVSALFAEWLNGSPYTAEVTTSRLLNYLNGVPAAFGKDARPPKLEWMIRQAGSLSGK